MLYYWTCSSIMHAFPHESLSNCATESNTGLKYNVNIWGGVGGGYPAVILHLACAVLEWTVLPLPCRPRISFTLKDQCFYYWSQSLQRRLIHSALISPFCLPKPLLPFLPARLVFKKDIFGRIKILQSDCRTNKPINWGIHFLVGRKDRGE